MRILLAPAGSRGDFQPMLALAVGLQAAGHAPVIASGECFREECAAFGIPFVRAGVDVRAFLHEHSKRGTFTPLRATVELVRVGRAEAAGFIRDLLAPSREVDLVIGGGAQLAAPTAAEAAGKPYWYMAYTPQILRSMHHPPFTIPIMGLPQFGNRLLWALSDGLSTWAVGERIQEARRELGLGRVTDFNDHVFPRGRSMLACDPELTPPPPDLGLFCPPLGSVHLPDARPLPEELQAFLGSGPAPLYIGFGSMPDQNAAATTRLILEAVNIDGGRAVVSSGWAGLGAGEVPPAVMVVGAVAHATLFAQVVAVVHHGGAGTAAASLRAGKPQLVVHHAFDQVGIGRQVQRAGVGPAPLARAGLTAKKLAAALGELRQQAAFASTAEAIGAEVRRRDPVGTIVNMLDQLVAVPRP
jgi:vancomycin aglycone glucosyltransferase